MPANAGDTGDLGLIPGSGRSFGVRNGNSSILAGIFPEIEEPGRLHTVHGVAESDATEHPLVYRGQISPSM